MTWLLGAGVARAPVPNCALRHSMARMAWFKKERKPRTSERVKLEIPADAWEKCDQCGHVDIRERFVRALNVCPNCGHHRRITAQQYIDLLVDEGSWHECWRRVRVRREAPLTSVVLVPVFQRRAHADAGRRRTTREVC